MEVGIVGGSGYAGGELLRILYLHPYINIKWVTSESQPGFPVALVHPNLRGISSHVFSRVSDVGSCDCIFLALPNGESMKSMETWIEKSEKVIDLGADFRIQNPAEWSRWYGTEHRCPQILNRFVYGVPEIFHDEIQEASCIAGPGCEAVVSILSLYPFVKNGLVRNFPVIIDAKMGSSQSGKKISLSTHHPERAGAVRSYKPTGHRHTAEIEQVLKKFQKDLKISVSATAVEMVRGILVTIQCFLEDDVGEKDIWRILRQEYSEKPFVRIVKQSQGLYRYPEPKILQGTNICEIGFEKESEGNRLVIMGALDNLVKGTAGNAVQCLNLMAGFPETMGLEFPGLHPV